MLEKLKSYIEPNRTVRNVMIAVMCLLVVGMCGSFFVGFSKVHADFGEIRMNGTVEMVRNFDEEDYDEDSTVCDVTYEADDAYMVVSYTYEEYEQLDNETITAYAYETDNGETLYFDHENPTMQEAQVAYQSYMANETMHCEVERRVVVLCGGKVTVDGDFCGKFFADFANKSLFGRLADIDFATGKLPPVLPLAISTLCGKYSLAIHYDSRHHLDAPHR